MFYIPGIIFSYRLSIVPLELVRMMLHVGCSIFDVIKNSRCKYLMQIREF